MPALEFELPGGEVRPVVVRRLFNAGYAGSAQDEVAAHVAELAELGVPAPAVTPALHPVAPYPAAQVDAVPAQHDRTSGERLRAWVRHGDREEPIQDAPLDALLPPSYWLGRLREHGWLEPGTVLLSGTVPMAPGADQFADGRRVELQDPAGDVLRLAYAVERLPEPIG